jgi:hypothetical protein
MIDLVKLNTPFIQQAVGTTCDLGFCLHGQEGVGTITAPHFADPDRFIDSTALNHNRHVETSSKVASPLSTHQQGLSEIR